MSTSGHIESDDPTQAKSAVSPSSLEQVREILVGPQHREFARRLARSDAHVRAQAEELKTDIKRRLEVLEGHLKSESDGLSARIDTQRSDQLEALGTLERETRRTLTLLEHRVHQLEESIARTQREFRQQILEQAKAFIEAVGRTREELGAALEREVVAYGGELEAGEPSEALEGAGRHGERKAA